MRDYSVRLWERYDLETLDTRRISQAISQALLEFMGYNRKTEYHDGVSLRSDDNEDAWARPLGIQTLLISFQSLTLVEPSGVAQSDLEFVAIGKESAAIQRVLREKYRPDLTTNEIQQLVLAIIQQTMEGQAFAELVVEIVSKDGVKVSSVPLRPSEAK
jgi:20S proteasome alpha/beta subunit